MKKLFLAVALLVATTAQAKWTETQSVTINRPTVHKGVTKSGKDKWYIVISDGTTEKQVSVSKSNAEADEIILVKWTDDETGKVRYSTRSAKARQTTPDYDLNRITTK